MGTPGALSWLQDGTVHLVYGILEEPVRSLEAINTSGLQTGLQRVQLLKPNISVPALPADLQTMEIRAPDILVPGQETTYWCYITKLPEGFSRHHIVMVRAVGAGVCVGGTAPGHVLLPALPPPGGLESCPRACLDPVTSTAWTSCSHTCALVPGHLLTPHLLRLSGPCLATATFTRGLLSSWPHLMGKRLAWVPFPLLQSPS